MPRKIFKRYLPDFHKIRTHSHLQIFGRILHDPNLWHVNRRLASGAFAVGLFMTFMPVPFQMVAAAALAILFRVNLPISVVLVWISNPVTIPPIFFFCYKVGTWLIGKKINEFAFEPTWHWLTNELTIIWQPFLLGCFVVGTIAALAGFYGIHALWRLHVVRTWEQRKKTRRQRAN